MINLSVFIRSALLDLEIPIESYDESSDVISPFEFLADLMNDFVDTSRIDRLTKICSLVNEIYSNRENFNTDIENEIQILLFYNLEQTTLETVKPLLLNDIVELGKEYLKNVQGDNFEDF
ncbi:hypothetical protein [Flavobacterium sp.]|uniref:hypothetical protein n=1 Tax=Flavobacterium sp. TaxID=239 RepID=UPI0039E2BFEC